MIKPPPPATTSPTGPITPIGIPGALKKEEFKEHLKRTALPAFLTAGGTVASGLLWSAILPAVTSTPVIGGALWCPSAAGTALMALSVSAFKGGSSGHTSGFGDAIMGFLAGATGLVIGAPLTWPLTTAYFGLATASELLSAFRNLVSRQNFAEMNDSEKLNALYALARGISQGKIEVDTEVETLLAHALKRGNPPVQRLALQILMDLC